jgi:hypothetical protein
MSKRTAKIWRYRRSLARRFDRFMAARGITEWVKTLVQVWSPPTKEKPCKN